jgi:thiamine phosphate synthase YjbQ (UPF0047 family)
VGLFDLTADCQGFVDDPGDGLLHVFVPHATCGLVIMELGSGSEQDLLEALDRLLPRDDRWRHRHGSPGHGADHVVPATARTTSSRRSRRPRSRCPWSMVGWRFGILGG